MNILEEIQNCPVEWKELGEVCEIETGKLNANESVEDGKYLFFTTAKEISRINSFRWNTEALLIAGNANVGDVKYYSGKFEAYQRTYVLTNFSHNVKARFLLHIIKQGLKYYLENNTNKAAMSYIVISTLKSFPIPIPPLEIQEKIVQILDKMTEYVTELTSELTSRKKQYSFYRDKLLSFEDEVYQVEWKTLGDIGKVSMCRRILKNQTSDDGEVPFYKIGTFGRVATSYISRELFEDYKLRFSYPKLGDVLISASGTIGRTVVFNGEDSYFQDSNIVWLDHDESQVLNRYLYYFYQMNPWKVSDGGTISRLYNGNIEKTRIPVPSLEIQSRIVQVLDNFDTVCNDLNIGLPKEIELRQKQYEFFREKLLTFTAEGVYPDSGQWTVAWAQSDLIKLLNWVFGPIRVELGQVVNLQRGKRLVKKQLTAAGSFPVYQNSLTPLGYFEQSNRVKETSFVICAGAAGEIGYSDTDFWAADDVYTLETSEDISDKFMYYVLLSKQDKLKSQVRKASIPRLSKDAIDKVTFYLPSFGEQERIVSILDKFNILTHSLSEGLPKEIEQRQKQYEYWREQLLNFTR
ncbi:MULTISPECIES: restriction endonuclease subunit S [unclassified Streptococcus]|uniref:restriction endonuclease subunit S n=1 Tax=unclassified Streptococcus TaxID=2608887 RepID=UPI0008A5A980|nr:MULTISPECIES: restriction endonuclease subunit S [unclassified Streptococcus]PNM84515.1 restriction endonuclease subunit S [Streptococcus sp. FDAARGOS_146]